MKIHHDLSTDELFAFLLGGTYISNEYFIPTIADGGFAESILQALDLY